MQGDLPIKREEILQLPAVGINASAINFSSVTMESDKYICVRDTQQKMINIVDIDTQEVTTNKVNAESAIMNPKTKVLALRANNTLQIFNLEMKTKMKEHKMTEAVLFWKWITPNVIALVTQGAVYHWSMEGTSPPKKMFDRHSNLDQATIINYRVDKSQKWLVLIGIAKSGDGSMKGVMQLYSVEKSITQYIDGHAAAFVDFEIENSYKTTLICIASAQPSGGKLFIMEVPVSKPEGAPSFQRKAVPVQLPTPNDFPVAMQTSDKHGIMYMITRTGYLYLYDVETATLIYKNRITNDTIFCTAYHEASNGLLGINKAGTVISISVDENTIVPYITNAGNTQLAINIASRANLSGADDLYVTQFNSYLQTNQLIEAVKLAAESPQGILRTPQTIQRFQRIPTQPGQKPALSSYFNYIISKGKLNQFESIELSKIVLQKPGGVEYIKGLIQKDKLESSEQLGDLVRRYSQELAMSIYLKGKAHDKIVDSLLEKGDIQRVLAYCERVQYTPNYLELFGRLVNHNPDAAVKFAVKIYEKEGDNFDPNVVVDIFVQGSKFKQATAFLLDILKEDKPEQGDLQTRILEINLLYSPVQVADSILKQNMFTHFNKQKIATLCEKAGLYQRALENYQDISDIKKVIVNTQKLDHEFLVNYFGNLMTEDCLSCMRELLKHNIRQNLKIVAEVATKFSEEIGPDNLIPVFEDFRSYEGLYLYLGQIVDFSQSPDVHFKYIEAAVRIGQYPEVERVTRESDYYDPQQVKDFLKEVKLQDQMPFINVCDKYGYIEEMVHYLYNNQQLKYINMYAQNRSPLKTPEVVGALLDVDASEEFIKSLILSVGNNCPTEPLVAEVEKRNRLKLLKQWLEDRMNEGSQEQAVHNAIAKIYIDLSKDPENFLKENTFYDKRTIGKYCEKRDPFLALIAYEKGQCDIELVELTNNNGMFKQQARYLVQRQDPALWAHVLEQENEHKRQIIDQVVQTALPESESPEQVSSTVKAFMNAKLPNELIELLEQIVIHGQSEFRTNKNLQNLLILTAIKADSSRVMGYVNRLENYDAPDIAQIAVEKELYEEAFAIYSKFELQTNAVRVLIENIGEIDRASEFAESVRKADVWSLLARAQLNNDLVVDGINSFMKAEDATSYHEVINAAEKSENFEDLIKFLLMARTKTQDGHIDTELVYSYAKLAEQKESTAPLADLEDFISSPNTAQLQLVGDRCFEEGLYEAARILYSNISNYSRLASALVKLGKNRDAVSAASKANSIKTWREVMEACVEAGDFKYAQSCGINIIVNADELDDLIQFYEIRGHTDELLELLEKGLGLEHAHKGIFTSLGVLYAKYKQDKVMEHITRYYRKTHIPKLLNACEQNHLWAEMRFLYCSSEEYDNAIKIMMKHSSTAFDHQIFMDTIVSVVNKELFYKAIRFYLKEKPSLVNDLLAVITKDLDHERVCKDVEKDNHPLIKPYLESVQQNNLVKVNDALNRLYVEEEDYEALRASIETYDNFDCLSLAKSLESHELLEFRRISAKLYKQKNEFKSSIELSKKDKLYKDCMETAAESQDQDVAEDLLKYFIDEGHKECFAACLYSCYDLIRPDVALEHAWKSKLHDMAMPYFIQVIREYTNKVNALEKKIHNKEEEERIQREEMERQMSQEQMNPPPMIQDQYYNQYNPQMMQQDQYQNQYNQGGFF